VAAKTKKLIPHIQTEIVPNAGHGAVFDQPEIVNELVADFINRVAAQR
jgi:pimeloyl-ACP methyl ester carboxylesterase